MRRCIPLASELQALAADLARRGIEPTLHVDLYAHIPQEQLQEVVDHFPAFRLAWHMAKMRPQT